MMEMNKKVLILLCFLCVSAGGFSQEVYDDDIVSDSTVVVDESNNTKSEPIEEVKQEEPKKKKKSTKSKKTVLDDISVKMDILNFCQQYVASNLNANRYKLYQTDNMNYLLKLDTFTGRVWMVQWSLDIAEEGSDVINGESLSNTNYCKYELYATKNIYQFMLLDKETGNQWHIQWGLEPENRWIRKID